MTAGDSHGDFGGGNKWVWKNFIWESCCQFYDELDPDDPMSGVVSGMAMIQGAIQQLR